MDFLIALIPSLLVLYFGFKFLPTYLFMVMTNEQKLDFLKFLNKKD